MILIPESVSRNFIKIFNEKRQKNIFPSEVIILLFISFIAYLFIKRKMIYETKNHPKKFVNGILQNDGSPDIVNHFQSLFDQIGSSIKSRNTITRGIIFRS